MFTQAERIHLENTEIENGDKEENEQQPKVLDPSNPIELVEWQQDLEAAIQETLKKLSQVVNILIQKNNLSLHDSLKLQRQLDFTKNDFIILNGILECKPGVGRSTHCRM